MAIRGKMTTHEYEDSTDDRRITDKAPQVAMSSIIEKWILSDFFMGRLSGGVFAH